MRGAKLYGGRCFAGQPVKNQYRGRYSSVVILTRNNQDVNFLFQMSGRVREWESEREICLEQNLLQKLYELLDL